MQKEYHDKPFSSLDYRLIIKYYGRQSKISQKDLAGWARVHTSYFSRVMKNETDFSAAQMYAIGKALGLDGPRLEFCVLAVEHAHSTDEAHREFLKKKIKHCQKEIDKIIGQLKDLQKEMGEEEINLYYKEAITAKIHMLFTLDTFCKNANLVKKELSLDEDKFQDEMQKLEKLGLIIRNGNKIDNVARRIHLSEEHELSKQNHINWRLDAIHQMTHARKKHNDYHFSASFSASDSEKELIKDQFKEFIVAAQKIVRGASKVNKTYHIGFDLY